MLFGHQVQIRLKCYFFFGATHIPLASFSSSVSIGSDISTYGKVSGSAEIKNALTIADGTTGLGLEAA